MMSPMLMFEQRIAYDPAQDTAHVSRSDGGSMDQLMRNATCKHKRSPETAAEPGEIASAKPASSKAPDHKGHRSQVSARADDRKKLEGHGDYLGPFRRAVKHITKDHAQQWRNDDEHRKR